MIRGRHTALLLPRRTEVDTSNNKITRWNTAHILNCPIQDHHWYVIFRNKEDVEVNEDVEMNGLNNRFDSLYELHAFFLLHWLDLFADRLNCYIKTPHNAYSTPATSPPTPLQRIDGMTMRSGREINNNRASGGTPGLGPQSSRIEKSSPKPRNGAGAKKGKKRKGKGSSDEPGQTLEAPLSRLVEHITNVQDTDIELYVKRSPEVRRQEVAESKDCKVKRPMNAFMLYRKAYQNRTKEWKKHDNHQIISQLCGYSWGIEDPELKARFDEWAKIERDNHKAAFPDYKFAPAKAKNKKPPNSTARRANTDDDDSDLDGYDWEGTSGPPSRSASRGARRPYDPEAEYRPPGRQYAPPYVQHPSPMMQHHPHPRQGGYPPHQSSFQYSNPGKPQPDAYGTRLGPNQYYQQTSEFMARPAYGHHPMAYSGMPFVENVYMNKANSPATSYHSSPIDHYGDMMGSAYPPPPQPQVAMPHAHHPIDPSLMSHQGPSQYDALGILPGLPDHGDTMPGYGSALDHGDIGGHDAHGQQHYDPSLFQQQPSTTAGGQETANTASVLPDTTWHDDTVLPKFEDSGWEKLAMSGEGDFRYEDMDAILETQDSPGG